MLHRKSTGIGDTLDTTSKGGYNLQGICTRRGAF